MHEEETFEKLQIKKEPFIFRNESGLVVFRRVNDPTEEEVSKKGLVIFTGLESNEALVLGDDLDTYYASSDEQHFRSPGGHLPVYLSGLRMEALLAEAINGVGTFKTEAGRNVIITEIPWEKLLAEDIMLYTNTPTFNPRQTGERVVRLVPEKTEGGYILKRTNQNQVNNNLIDAFTSKGALISPAGEYLIASPSQEVHDITPILQGSRLSYIKTGSNGSPGQTIYSRNI